MPSSPRALAMPPRLGPGARVALIAPSSPLRGDHELEHAVSNARDMGWDPVVGVHANARDGYFAGADEVRAADLMEALTDQDIDGIWCLRGGYGAARLLPTLGFDRLRAHPKALIGYSDITALHAAWQHAGLASFHGPTARATLSEFTRTSFQRTVVDGGDGTGAMPAATTLRDGTATGRLAGGNLALIASLCGTPWAIDFRGAIVVVEDINEATYRIDRMLTQLRLAGAFQGCAGFLFGQFTTCPIETEDGARPLEAVMRECADSIGVPSVLGAPFGHVDDQWTLPLGCLATLDASQCTLQVHATD